MLWTKEGKWMLGTGCESNDLRFFKKNSSNPSFNELSNRKYHQNKPRFNEVYSKDNLP